MMAKPVVKLKQVEGRSIPQYRHPERILEGITSKEKLEKVLEWYSYPFIKHRVPDTAYARRRYVEQTRPALRFFCKKFGVEVPGWLKGNGHYDSLPPDEHEDFFGEGPLDVTEFGIVGQEGEADASADE